ncbi:MAG: cyclomaltodextrinase N-terminal domain-containing protein, partial [Parabacteroides sp.]|nr:cyclomaltodextrinase N-terminal domain-containing protein [Parabacteroides sp.]
MDPPFWYAGMHNQELQIMFYGNNVGASSLSLEHYEGVEVKEICKLENPNYLVVYLDVSEVAKPGTMRFLFEKDGKKKIQEYELKERNHKPGAMGFTSKDVLYLIMPDRFANGNPDNDVYDGYEVDRRGNGRHGGDIQGIVDHLDYINHLGATAIWLNPVQYNKGGHSHGYAISDFYL